MPGCDTNRSHDGDALDLRGHGDASHGVAVLGAGGGAARVHELVRRENEVRLKLLPHVGELLHALKRTRVEDSGKEVVAEGEIRFSQVRKS